jgi:hypothetical protein
MNIAKNMEIIFIAALALASATSLAHATVPAQRSAGRSASGTCGADDGRDDHRQAPDCRSKSPTGRLIVTFPHLIARRITCIN